MSAPAREYIASDGRKHALTTMLGKPGGEGTTYRIAGEPHLVAKIYHIAPDRQAVEKLEWMIAHPPAGASPAGGSVVLAWPLSLLRDTSGAVRGFTMPLVDSPWELSRIFDPKHRARLTTVHGGPFGWHHLHEVARNLAMVVQACHAAGYVIGDLNNNNTRVSRSGQISLIDTDSFQVTARRGARATVHHCGVAYPEYTPPELLGKDLPRTVRSPSADGYILAVLIFKLLQDGVHPFSGRCNEDPPPDPMTLASRGWFPYDDRSKMAQPHPGAPTFGRLHPRLTGLFRDCFVRGIRDPDRRPTADAWVSALTDARIALRTCANGHYYSAHGSGALCLHLVDQPKGGRRYCGSTEKQQRPALIPLLAVDPVTGAVSRAPTRPKPLPPVRGASKPGPTGQPARPSSADPLLLRPFLALFRGVRAAVSSLISAIFQAKVIIPAVLLLAVWGGVSQGYTDDVQGVVTRFWQETVTDQGGEAASGAGSRSSADDDLEAPGMQMLADGRRGGLIIFSARQGDAWSLNVLDPTRKQYEPVIADMLIDPVPAWSSGGDRIAFALRYRSRVEIHLLDIARERVTIVTRFGAGVSLTRLAWSVDDRRLLASIDSPGGARIVQVTLSSGEISDFLPVSSAGLAVSHQGETAYTVIERGDANIVIGDAQGDACCYVARSPAQERYPAFSPDGQWLAFSVSASANEHALAIGARDGIEQIRFANQPVSTVPTVPAWSPDGVGSAFAACEPDRCRIYLGRFDGSLEILLSTSRIDRIGMISWQMRSPAIEPS